MLIPNKGEAVVTEVKVVALLLNICLIPQLFLTGWQTLSLEMVGKRGLQNHETMG